MKKITEYFYIFSKLTTSLVLFLIMIIMGYALFKSYQLVDKSDEDLEKKLSSLSENIVESNRNVDEIEKKMIDTNKSLDDIMYILSQKNIDAKNTDYKNDIENLLKLNKELQKQIDQIILNLEITNKQENINSNSIEFNQINSLIKLIFAKYENGESVSKELLLLEELQPSNKKYIFEKIYLLEINKFYGLENLAKDFDQSVSEFLKVKFSANNKNYLMNFLLNLVTIKPGNLTVYENKELNILMKAKKHLETGNIQKSLNQIFLIDEKDKFFSQWIEQVKIYLEFKSLIEMVS